MLYQGMQEQYGLLFWMNELFPILSESRPSWDADLFAVEVVGLLASSTATNENRMDLHHFHPLPAKGTNSHDKSLEEEAACVS